MSRTELHVDDLRHLLSGFTLTVGVPAFNEGDGVLPTLQSLWEGLLLLDITNAQLIVSDSHDDSSRSSMPTASAWARETGANLRVHTAAHRRSLKEALNVVLDHASSDVVIMVNADVVVPAKSLATMIRLLLKEPRPAAVIGATLPDPAFKGVRRRAGAWQLRTVTRLASMAPRTIGPKSFRAEGAFWGVSREFYSGYRFPLASGSIADDIELVGSLIAGGYKAISAPDAFVYKVPPSSVADLCLGVIRGQAATPSRQRRANEYTAGLVEAFRDPLGALLYIYARLWCARKRKILFEQSATEHWRVLDSTKRGGS